jgi:putative oxidoreductase
MSPEPPLNFNSGRDNPDNACTARTRNSTDDDKPNGLPPNRRRCPQDRFASSSPIVHAKGIPAPRVAVLGSGVLILFGGLSIALGFRPVWGTISLTVFLVPTTLTLHNFWADTDPSARMNNLVNFEKNMALLGAAWMFLMLPQPWLLSLG